MHAPSIKVERKKKTMSDAKENKGKNRGQRGKKTGKTKRRAREVISCGEHLRIRRETERNAF